MASILQQPPALVEPFAINGDKNTLPKSDSGDQRASLDLGFPPITGLPINEGGIPPERADFNALGNLTTSQYFFIQNGGRFTFNQTVSDAIGGYPAGAVLQYTSGNESYQVISLINNNTFNFVVTPSYIDNQKWAKAYSDLPSTVGKSGLFLTNNGISTEWADLRSEILNKFQVVTALPQNPTSGVFYFVTE